MFSLSNCLKAILCLGFVLLVGINLEAQSGSISKKKEKERPFMFMAFEAPLWLTNPNTLDNSHTVGFGFKIEFPINRGPWNFITGFSNYNYGNHINLLDVTESSGLSGNEGTITVKDGVYAIKYAGLPLGFRLDKKYWSTSFGVQLMFNLNQAEIHSQNLRFIFGADEFEDFSKEKVNGLNSTIFYSFAGKLPLGNKWSFYIEPEFQYLMKSVYVDNIDEIKRANIFLKLGLRHLISLPSEE